MNTAPLVWLGNVLDQAIFTPAQKVVAAALAAALAEGDQQIGYRQLAGTCGVSQETAMRSALRLESEGWLTIIRIEGEANVFALSLPRRLDTITKVVRR